jgi:hypothetical protein
MKCPDYKKYACLFLVTYITIIGCVKTDNSNPIHDNPFIILPGQGKAIVLQPNGEEQWFIGSNQEITWAPGVVPDDTTVTLLLSLNGGNNFSHIIVSNTPNDGSFTWIVPDLPSKQSVLQMVASVSSDISDREFLILRKPDPKQVTSEGGEWPSWRSDRLAYMSNRSGNWDIFVTTVYGNSPNIPVTSSAANDRYPNFDNKGFHLTFASDRTGREEIWATTQFFNRITDKIQLTNKGGTHPTWRPLPTSTELGFLSFSSPGLLNISTLKIPAPLTRFTTIATPVLLADNSNKARPSWVIESGNEDRIFYKDFGARTGPNVVKNILINGGFNTPESIELPFPGSLVRNPSISPSGAKLAVTVGHDIWVMDIENGQIVGKALQVTFDPASDDLPDLHSDLTMAFQSNRSGRFEIWWLTLP